MHRVALQTCSTSKWAARILSISRNSYLVLKIWKPYVVRIYPGSTFLLILCEGLERSQISKAENYDESKSGSMKTYPCCAALGFWRFRCFAVREDRGDAMHEELRMGTDVAVG